MGLLDSCDSLRTRISGHECRGDDKLLVSTLVLLLAECFQLFEVTTCEETCNLWRRRGEFISSKRLIDESNNFEMDKGEERDMV